MGGVYAGGRIAVVTDERAGRYLSPLKFPSDTMCVSDLLFGGHKGAITALSQGTGPKPAFLLATLGHLIPKSLNFGYAGSSHDEILAYQFAIV